MTDGDTAIADPITSWLGTPDLGNPPVEEPQPKAINDDPSRDPVGAVRLFDTSLRDDTGLAIRWRDPADTTEPYPWLILGSDGPQKLSNDSVRDCARVGVVPTRGDGVTTTMPRLQVLWLPGERYALVFDNITDQTVFDSLDIGETCRSLGAVTALFLQFPVEVL